MAGLAWCAWVTGVHVVEPGSVAWAFRGDAAMGFFTWLFQRDAPLTLPLGAQDRYLHPVGVSLAMADGIPWVGTLLRPLAPALPSALQYLGPFMALSFALQGYVGLRLARRLTPHRVAQVLIGCLFVVAPVLAFRTVHASLTAHWLPLAVVGLHLDRPGDRRQARRHAALALGAVALAAGVHPYILAMTLALALALLVRLAWADRALGWAEAGAWGAATLCAALAVLGLFGYLGGGSPEASGFSMYSANLHALFNSFGYSRWVPGLPAVSGQYEGFGFLGAGAIALVVLALVLLPTLRREPPLPWRRWAPLVLVCLAMAAFALSYKVTLGDHTLVTYERLYTRLLAPLGRTFRVPGRFIWPVHYLVLVGALALVCKRLERRPAALAAVLAAALALQVTDFPAAWSRTRFDAPAVRTFQAAAWADAARDYRHLVLFPPRLQDAAGHGCAEETYSLDEAAQLAWLAYERGLTFNSGYVARLDVPRTDAYCAASARELAAGALAPDSVYVVHRSRAAALREALGERGRCGELDGEWVCVSAERATPLARALEARAPAAARGDSADGTH